MGRAGFSYNDVDFVVIDTIDTHRCCNQNSHFYELDIGNDTSKATDTL
jgi:hypothetical protein